MARRFSQRLPRWLQPKHASIVIEPSSRLEARSIPHCDHSIRAVPTSKHPQAVDQQAMALKQVRKLYEKRAYLQALAVCRQVAPADRGADLQALQDEICMHSAATGTIIGFDGQVLQVQPAEPAAAWTGQQPQQQQRQAAPSSTYSSIAEALAAAADGDTIQLLPGTHTISQVCLDVDKRVLIEGLGSQPQQVLLDHRANHPAFNITRWVGRCTTRHATAAAGRGWCCDMDSLLRPLNPCYGTRQCLLYVVTLPSCQYRIYPSPTLPSNVRWSGAGSLVSEVYAVQQQPLGVPTPGATLLLLLMDVPLQVLHPVQLCSRHGGLLRGAGCEQRVLHQAHPAAAAHQLQRGRLRVCGRLRSAAAAAVHHPGAPVRHQAACQQQHDPVELHHQRRHPWPGCLRQQPSVPGRLQGGGLRARRHRGAAAGWPAPDSQQRAQLQGPCRGCG
eukprot:GHRQ01010071.1.p1 GENE.GHRQ01010071.1~~GHRQ01010071.1.p1  ORF type:complete len:445 (+),score=105.51 GHRQ01010071.1:157-1491(+)